MNIELVTRDLQATDMLRQRIETKLGKLQSRLEEKVFMRVRLATVATNQYSCSINFTAAQRDFAASTEGADLVRAADETIAKLERQIAKAGQKDARGSIRDSAL